jgi:hypothetical protein
VTDLDLTQDELEALMSEPPEGYPLEEPVQVSHRFRLEYQAKSGLDTFPETDPDA